MKLSVALLAIMLLTTACTSHTPYGECIGVQTQENPKLNYEISWWNAFVGIFFSETIIVPVIVIFDDIKCPYGTKT